METELAQQSQALQELISEMEWKSWDSALELLQEVKVVLERRSKSWNLKKLDIVSPDLRSVCCVPGLKKVLRTCGEYTTLDQDTASPPCQIRIFLKYEDGIVSYNITDHGSLIYTFSECAFTGPLQPFFNSGFNDGGGNAGPRPSIH
ncbi:E3 ubiquitin-protein ligase TRIM21 [Sciurus carolinensis]|uniref:E3 ubiquitin-protein ligase TRIM21 n=1 Tax=Sciurus carolinensis TaxID=30640 RepID=A0AA41MCH8_SCICA|nr:E3 ubiquitin-protein ligase TRIM21 [Sciurus carolinensis]